MTFKALLEAFRSKRVLVVGDVMIDEYVFGTAQRISPEAPVIVLNHERTQVLPGGAANVAKNVSAFGAAVHLIGVVGDDDGADSLQDALTRDSIPNTLITEGRRKTTRKTRVLAGESHQVVRIDSEDVTPIQDETIDAISNVLQAQIGSIDAILLSDYCKGGLPERLARVIQQHAKAAWKPVVVNAKPNSLDSYRGSTLITLNRAEASTAAGAEVILENASDVAESLRTKHRAEGLVITMGSEGMAVAGPEGFLIPSPRVEVADPAGAGDTVVAAAALGVATAGFDRSVFELAARAASCVVRHVGVATVSQADLEAMAQA